MPSPGRSNLLRKIRSSTDMSTQSIGLIETLGLVAAIEAADTSLKIADVSLGRLVMAGGGRVTVTLMGDISSVKVSVEVGSCAARRLGQVLSATVIARAGEGIDPVCVRPVAETIQEKSQASAARETVSTSPNRKGLEAMSVAKLRTLARAIVDFPIHKNAIKSARKQDLISGILAHYNQQGEHDV